MLKKNPNTFTIAIDGPAASGKGTLSKKIAEALTFAHLDTGALYRATALHMIEHETDAITAANHIKENLFDTNTPRLKDDDIGQMASKIAAEPEIRAILLDLQKTFAANPPNGTKGSVLDGRDIGTVVCPNADIKLFITAPTEIRAQRRLKELQLKDKAVTYEAVLKDMRERDARDQGRKTAPMMPADDALIIDTGHLTAEDAFEKAMTAVRARLKT